MNDLEQNKDELIKWGNNQLDKFLVDKNTFRCFNHDSCESNIKKDDHCFKC